MSAMLNQTNIGNNNNKFFLIQCLQRTGTDEYASWFRWGRVGYEGQKNLQTGLSRETAMAVFEQKFNDKTLNEWAPEIYQTFSKCDGKYHLLSVDSLTGVEQLSKPEIHKIKIEYEETKLPIELFNLIQLISSKEMMTEQLTLAGIDLTKMPLGKISASMLLDAFKILKKIESELSGNNSVKLTQLSSDFYTIIPHNFGFQKMSNFIIKSKKLLKDKIELIESLNDVMELNESN